MAGSVENLQHAGAEEEERIPPRYRGISDTTMYHGYMRHASGDASGVQHCQTDDLRECIGVARDASKDPQAGKDAGGAQAGQCVRDALLADCTSPWRPSSTCRTSSTAGDLELKDISFPF